MAEKPAESKREAEAPAAPPKKKGKFKVIAMIAGLMLGEAGALVVILGLGGPAKSQASTVNVKSDESEKTKEVMIVDDKFQNLQAGRVWVWDAAVYVRAKAKNAPVVDGILSQRGAEIKEGISQIFSKAQLVQLKEPDRQTLNRQISAFLDKVFVHEDGAEPLIERVFIPKCRGFPAEY
jgi:flagellar basal body-associated protein FliL